MPLHNNVGVHGDGILSVWLSVWLSAFSVCVCVCLCPQYATQGNALFTDWNTIRHIRDYLIFCFKMHMEHHDTQNTKH